jgi:hypothetical protein
LSVIRLLGIIADLLSYRALVIFDDGVLEHLDRLCVLPGASASEEREIAQQVTYDDGTAR